MSKLFSNLINKGLTAPEIKTYSRRPLTNKENGYLSLAMSQTIEKIFTQKLKYEEFESLQEIIRTASNRSKETNLNEAVKHLLRHPKQGYERFELEKRDASVATEQFLQFLLNTNIETKLDEAKRKILLERLKQGKASNPWTKEFDQLIAKLEAIQEEK